MKFTLLSVWRAVRAWLQVLARRQPPSDALESKFTDWLQNRRALFSDVPPAQG